MQGLAETFHQRLSVIVINTLNLCVNLVFWIGFSVSYWAFYFFTNSQVKSTSQASYWVLLKHLICILCVCQQAVKVLLVFIFSSKAFGDLVVWLAVTRIYSQGYKNTIPLDTFLSFFLVNANTLNFKKMLSSSCKSELSAQGNDALCLELQHFISTGENSLKGPLDPNFCHRMHELIFILTGIVHNEEMSGKYTDPSLVSIFVPVRLIQ